MYQKYISALNNHLSFTTSVIFYDKYKHLKVKDNLREIIISKFNLC